MAKQRKITRAAAAEAKAKLQEFSKQIDRHHELGRDDPNNPTPWRGPDATRRAETAESRARIHDQLLQQSAEVACFVREVGVAGFHEHSPESGREPVQRAIGIYARIEAGGAQPDPPSPEPKPVSRAGAADRRWWITALIGLASGGLGTAVVNAYWGTAVRCEPNEEFVCPPINGVAWGARCKPSGVGRTLCMPLWKLRELGAPPTPPSAVPVPAAAP